MVGDNPITFDVPSWAVDGPTYARVRLSTAGGLGAAGLAADGEVEDYQVTIASPSPTAGVFGGQNLISTGANRANSVFAADVDGDGDTDVLSASNWDDKIAWYENNGSQIFIERAISTTADGAHSVFATDVDGGSYAIDEGDSLDLGALESSDPDDDTLTFSWDLNEDGTFGDATGATPTLTWSDLQALGINDDGPFTVTVRVDDGNGGVGEASTTLTVDNTAPTLAISGAESVDEGGTYTLNLSSSDPGDDTIGSWAINWGDGNLQTVPDNPSSATHVYADGPNTFAISATGTAFTTATTITETDTTYDNQDILIDGATAAINGLHDFNSVHIVNGGVLTHSAPTSSATYKLDLTVVEQVIVDATSRIDVDGRGYQGVSQGTGAGPGGGQGSDSTIYGGAGGGYGGFGGNSSFGSTLAYEGGDSYGSLTMPTDLGSAGGGVYTRRGGHGGGAIRLDVGGTLQLEGTISADGTDGSFYNTTVPSSGGGSGGSVLITAGTFTGGGSITADGGNSPNSAGDGGGGSGGRVAVYYYDLSGYDTDRVSVNGGTSAYDNGDVGTIYYEYFPSGVPEFPDLWPTALSVPVNGESGDDITVSWSVENRGAVATSALSWVDTFVLSTDDTFGNADDHSLGDYEHQGTGPGPQETWVDRIVISPADSHSDPNSRPRKPLSPRASSVATSATRSLSRVR